MTLEFTDMEGRSARYTTETWFDGGSSVTREYGTHYVVHGGGAGPGQHTVLSLRNP
ncbi:hypothetical protein [Streptomyces sp. NPDC096030]|uniref:hypothetical protein n=1 Tax=Streptomyces sp. NPDC096030 TaxID=3155423 RepID=UPI00332AC130